MILSLSDFTSVGYLDLASPNLWNGVVDNVILKVLVNDIDILGEECLAVFLVGVCIFFLLVGVFKMNGMACSTEK